MFIICGPILEKQCGPDNKIKIYEEKISAKFLGSRNHFQKVVTFFSMIKKYKFCIIFGRYDVSVAKKTDQSQSVNKSFTKL